MSSTGKEERMEKAEQTEELGRIEKIFFVDEDKNIVGAAQPRDGSKQLDEDPFKGLYDNEGLREPPYPLESFINLSERHPVHAAALEQKATDVIGAGWRWETFGKQDHEEQKTRLEAGGEDHPEVNVHFEGLAGDDADETMLEILHTMQLDFETTGQGYLEVIRDPLTREVKQLVHMPAHTVRTHTSKLKYAQIRNEKKVWFKKWGAEGEIDWETGEDLAEGASGPRVANEVLVFKKQETRSSYYGIPKWVSATGWIMLALAARDYNILFFENNREPRWAVVITDIQADENITEVLRQAFTVDLKQPHRNLIIPIKGGGQVKFNKLGSEQVDGTFQKLLQLCDEAILLGHRVPPERVGAARTGPLGGNVANVSNKVYRESIVRPSQALVASRMNKFLLKEFPDHYNDHRWKLIDLDFTAEEANVEKAVKLYRHDISLRNEARKMAGLPPLPDDDPRGNMFFSETQTAAKVEEINAQADADEKAALHQQALSDIDTKFNELTAGLEDMAPRSRQPAPGVSEGADKER